MKEKKEDDESRPKSTNESMQINQSADLLIHVELEQLSKCSRFQLNPGKGSGVHMESTIFQLLYDSSFFRANLWWFLWFSCTISYYDDDYDEEYDDE